MKKAHLYRVAFAACVILFCASFALAQDWPQWRGENRDGKTSGFKAPEQWPKELTQKWKVAVGMGCATPALVGDKLYVFTRQGDEEVILSLNAVDGNELWKDKYAAQEVIGPPGSFPGPRSSPAVAEGKVVTLGVGGVLSCLDAATGKVVWREDPFSKVVPKFFTSMSPIIVDGMAIAHLGGEGNGAMIAYELTSSNEKWRWSEEGPGYASPVLLTVESTKQIVALTENSIVGISTTDGKLLWKLPFLQLRMSCNSVTPIVDGQTVIYTGVNRSTTAVKIKKEGDGFATEELWKNKDVDAQYNTPVLKDGLLFGLSKNNNLFCINAQTGQTNWIDPTARGQGGFAAIVDAGSCLMALPNGSELFVFKPDKEKYEELARIKVAETETYAHPVLSGNRLFIKDENSVTLFIIE